MSKYTCKYIKEIIFSNYKFHFALFNHIYDSTFIVRYQWGRGLYFDWLWFHIEIYKTNKEYRKNE